MGLAAENDPHINFNMKKRNPIARRQGSSPTFSLINTSSQTGDTNLNVTELINKLRSFRQVHQRINVPESDIFTLCQQAREIFLSDPMLLEVEAPLRIVGDIHGQFSDLLRIMNHAGYPPAVSYLFLGDYVDRGKNSLETMVMLLALKVKYPNNMHMLRGNHESHIVNRSYGFYDECKRRYTVKLWKSFVDCYNCMPVAAIVSKRIFCCHGGISQSLNEMKDIKAIKRPTEVPEQGLMCDLLWSDPDHKNFGFSPSDRGVSFLFGRDVLEKFLRKFDFDLVCRGHQVVEDGYEFFAKRQMVTLFSAPNYCGQWDNAGASMGVDHNLMVTFAVLKPVEKKKGAK